MAKIKALRVLPGMLPQAVEIDSGLRSLQAEVGGSIELVSLDAKTDAYVNEEGLLERLPFNRYLPTKFGGGRAVPVVGNVIIVSHDHEGETVGLTDEQVSYWSVVLAQMGNLPQSAAAEA